MDRRALLTSLSTVGVTGLTGCSDILNDDIPAGSLQFENRDDLPHVIGVSVVDVGAEPRSEPDRYGVAGDVSAPPQQRELTASSSVAPGETQTFKNIFTEPVYYLVEFTVDGTVPETGGRIPFNPSPSGREYDNVLMGVVYASGEFSYGISSTGNAGRFDR
ncbi:hypothetical protein M0R89_06325 [Halorussus limi]|uniref:Uncharacterized protein n=1 Tax=Halorussus limi TaxID=2938695 RepID=A0A8U0HX23_9EURY|nr:hypothetical protein [Halorussus limi]UPV75675.1 hypothetical protein M0R89_06325 [Halorussus limi]